MKFFVLYKTSQFMIFRPEVLHRTSVFSETVGVSNSIEVFGFKSRGEGGVLTWRGDGAEGDPC